MLKFRFSGGFLDGLEVSQDSSDKQAAVAYRQCVSFECDVIGKFFNTPSPEELQELLKLPPAEKSKRINAAMHHRYTATDRFADGDDEVVVMQHSIVDT